MYIYILLTISHIGGQRSSVYLPKAIDQILPRTGDFLGKILQGGSLTFLIL
jgi:hypothetical protein